MSNKKYRKQLIEDILHSFHAMRHKMKPKGLNLAHKNLITHSQWFVLGIIGKRENTSVKDISKILGVTSSGVTQLVDGLVQNRYVTRKENPKDRRLIRLELSSKGQKHIAMLKEKRINEMAEIFDTLTDNELETYIQLHNKIISKFLDK